MRFAVGVKPGFVKERLRFFELGVKKKHPGGAQVSTETWKPEWQAEAPLAS